MTDSNDAMNLKGLARGLVLPSDVRDSHKGLADDLGLKMSWREI